MINQQMVFIIGCPRSGSSILAECLGRNDDVLYLGEEAQDLWNLDGFLSKNDPYLEHHERFPDMVSPMLLNHIDAGLRAKMALRSIQGYGRLDAPVILDKCPPNSLRIKFLLALFPSAKFIHVIRDGRDVVCSLEPGLQDNQWKFVKPRHWRMIAGQPEPLRRASLLWRYIVNRVDSDLDDCPSDSHRRILYDSLIASPHKTIGGLCRFMGIDSTDQQRQWAADNVSSQTNKGYNPPSQAHWTTDDHRNRIGRYKENLSGSDAEMVYAMLNVELRKYGYIYHRSN